MRALIVSRCSLCDGSLVAYSGIVGMYCYACDQTTPIFPRKLMTLAPHHEPMMGSHTPVMESCLMCGKAVPSSLRRGAGERATFCGNHSAEDKARGNAERAGKCVTPNCNGKASARGKCTTCYSRWWRNQQKR
jgi:hypothetical protein